MSGMWWSPLSSFLLPDSCTHAQAPKPNQTQLAPKTTKYVSGQIVHKTTGSWKPYLLPSVAANPFRFFSFSGFPVPGPDHSARVRKSRGVAASGPQAGP